MKTLPVVLLLLLPGFMACKKEQPQELLPVNNPQPPYPLVTKKTQTAYGNTHITTYRYDTATWLVKSITDEYGMVLYQYDTTRYILLDNGFLKLNADGLVEEDHRYFTPTQISYDLLRRVKEEYVYMSSRKQYAYFPDGSLQSMTATLPDHVGSPQGPSITTYFYTNYLPNKLANRNYGMPYFGESSTYLPDSSFNVLYYNGDSILSFMRYSYQLNKAGWVLRETIVGCHLNNALQPVDTSIAVTEYEYY